MERSLGFELFMWRAFFCAIGIVLLIFGLECLLIDNATLASGIVEETPQANVPLFQGASPINSARVVKPAEWMPWSMLACGAVVLLYALTVNRKWGEG